MSEQYNCSSAEQRDRILRDRYGLPDSETANLSQEVHQFQQIPVQSTPRRTESKESKDLSNSNISELTSLSSTCSPTYSKINSRPVNTVPSEKRTTANENRTGTASSPQNLRGAIVDKIHKPAQRQYEHRPPRYNRTARELFSDIPRTQRSSFHPVQEEEMSVAAVHAHAVNHSSVTGSANTQQVQINTASIPVSSPFTPWQRQSTDNMCSPRSSSDYRPASDSVQNRMVSEWEKQALNNPRTELPRGAGMDPYTEELQAEISSLTENIMFSCNRDYSNVKPNNGITTFKNENGGDPQHRIRIRNIAQNIVKLQCFLAFDPNCCGSILYDAASNDGNSAVQYAVSLALGTDDASVISSFLQDRSWMQSAPKGTLSNAAFIARGQTRAHDALQTEATSTFFDHCPIGCALRTGSCEKKSKQAWHLNYSRQIIISNRRRLMTPDLEASLPHVWAKNENEELLNAIPMSLAGAAFVFMKRKKVNAALKRCASGDSTIARELTQSHCKPWARIVLDLDSVFAKAADTNDLTVGRLLF
eukprot:IDg4433t1